MGLATLFCCELAVGLGWTGGEKTGGQAMRSAGSPYSGPCLVWLGSCEQPPSPSTDSREDWS